MKYKIRCHDAFKDDETFLKDINGELLKIEGFDGLHFGITHANNFAGDTYDVSELITGMRVVSGTTRSMAVSLLHAKIIEKGIDGFNSQIVALVTKYGVANKLHILLDKEKLQTNELERD